MVNIREIIWRQGILRRLITIRVTRSTIQNNLWCIKVIKWGDQKIKIFLNKNSIYLLRKSILPNLERNSIKRVKYFLCSTIILIS